MNFKFSDFENPELFNEGTSFVMVVGKYSLFNDMVINKFRNLSKGKKTIKISADTLAEFGMESDDGKAVTISNKVSLENFKDVIVALPPSGKWYCYTPWAGLTKKEKEWVLKYIKAPSENGILVVSCEEFKEYASFLRSKDLATSKKSHLIQLSWPDKKILRDIVENMFADFKVIINKAEIELFIMRMSSSYNEYASVISNICASLEPGTVITKQQLLDSMKGINNCVIDDFVDKLLTPFKNDTPSNRKMVFKMLGALLNEYGARGLVIQLQKQIDQYILFREEINKGTIPVLIRYSLADVKNNLGKDHPLTKVSDYRFRRLAFIASRTSLRDWVYMKMILSTANNYNPRSYEEALYRLVIRSVLNPSRLNNSIGITTDLDNIALSELDSMPYNENSLMQVSTLNHDNLAEEMGLHYRTSIDDQRLMDEINAKVEAKLESERQYKEESEAYEDSLLDTI